ncbi:hypothetical protein RV14_GL001805 [Enterococcus ratti]|uniref:Uncharacterized protein n=2 Tax=Enterococcus ratti TaxID=150033 RepID=A0A1L8WQ25_9ENTE|nr:hypothetical protein RV14_GL001805 [Enterococcus ratti]
MKRERVLFFNRKGGMVMTEMARILTKIKETEESNHQKKEKIKEELSQYEKLKNDEIVLLNKAYQERLVKLIKEKRKTEEEITVEEQQKLELILDQFRQKVFEIEKTYLKQQETEELNKKKITNEIIERMKEKNGCH